jgi:hypothetical protein
MRTFAQKQNQPQRRLPSNLTQSKTATLRPHHPEHPILRLHHTIGNQAVQRMLQANAGELEVGLTGTAAPRFGHDFSRVLVHPPAAEVIPTKLAAPRVHDHRGTQTYRAQQPVAMFAGIAPVEALIPAASHRVLRQPEAGEESTKQTAEEKERAKLLTEFTGGAELPEQQVSRIASAMRAFSLRQLQAMRKAGVRFWAPDSLPPEFKDHVEVENVSTPGQYLDTLRLIRMAKNASTDSIRHEMAHAWDHVRTGKVKPIAGLKGEEFDKALKDTPALSSETEEKRATKETHQGKVRSVRIPISEMFERYKKWKLREQSFDNPSTREGYSKTSPKEFYAEGYSVFHGGREWNQARLLYYAPELYELLEAEAKQQGLSVPDRSKIEAALKEQKLQ